jgi:hypothetical protein
MRATRWQTAGGLLVVLGIAAAVFDGIAEAASLPSVTAYYEGATPGSYARTVTVVGTALNKITVADIVGPAPALTANPVVLLTVAKTSATFTLANGLAPGDYSLRMGDKKGNTYPVALRLSLGSVIVTSVPASAITGSINATTLGGLGAGAFLRTTGGLLSGQVTIDAPVSALAAATSTAGANTMEAHNNAVTGGAVAFLGDIDSDTGSAVVGASLLSAGYGVGVYGFSYSPNGAGTLGYNAATTGSPAIGVFGLSSSPQGIGVEAINSAGGDALYAVSSTGRAAVFNTTGLAANSTASLIEVYQTIATVANVRFRVRADGNVYCDGSFNGGGADVAERIDGTEPLEPGDLVAIDPASPGKFRRSRARASTLVAGVVSTSPGLVMGNDPSDGPADAARNARRPALALAGRVPIRVCDENGPIGIGDLLVSSSRPGMAMRAGPGPAQPGTVVGKALETFAGGEGRIDSLLTLR